jgi:hypothetical protein
VPLVVVVASVWLEAEALPVELAALCPAARCASQSCQAEDKPDAALTDILSPYDHCWIIDAIDMPD